MNTPKLAILIPTLVGRQKMFERLYSSLEAQIISCLAENEVEIIVSKENEKDPDKRKSIGRRRNILLNYVKEKKIPYFAFFDDDDMPLPNYLQSLLQGIQDNADVISLKGIYTVNGINPEVFEHSLSYNEWRTNINAKFGEVKYERPPNHLNCIKTELIGDLFFQDISHGEDKIFSEEISNRKVLKKEHKVEMPIYQYLKIQ